MPGKPSRGLSDALAVVAACLAGAAALAFAGAGATRVSSDPSSSGAGVAPTAPIGAVGAGVFAPFPGTPVASDAQLARSRAAAAYARLPLSFEPNRGQFDRHALFVARGPGSTLLLTRRSAVLSLAAPKSRMGGVARGAALQIRFVGASADPRLRGLSALPGRVNYLIGRRASWHVGIPTYARVGYAGVWPGIGASFYGRQGRLEYDFDLAARADPGRIALRVRRGEEPARRARWQRARLAP